MVQTGLDVFLEQRDACRGRRVALVANQTSVTAGREYSWDAFMRGGIDLRRIFSPEHGIFSTEQDQVAVQTQEGMRCEIVSLYGDSHSSLKPPAGSLDDIDCVVFDIQDVGARYYTYVNTMALFMESIAGNDVEFMVLDRPNPLGGETVEGPVLRNGFESFVGVFHIPVRHGMTAAELALLYRDAHRLDVNLNVVAMRGWRRTMMYRDTGLQWIPPSPNMPTTTTALVYPGMCMLEGTCVSEGRGTTYPFLVFGAPFVEPEAFSGELNLLDLPGVFFRPVRFKPVFNKFAGQAIGGAYLHVLDASAIRPFLTGAAVIKKLYDWYGGDFRFLYDVYEFNSLHPAFDLLAGSAKIREMICGGETLAAIADSWRPDEEQFSENRKPYLRYA